MNSAIHDALCQFGLGCTKSGASRRGDRYLRSLFTTGALAVSNSTRLWPNA